jgi:hypothetical protein
VRVDVNMSSRPATRSIRKCCSVEPCDGFVKRKRSSGSAEFLCCGGGGGRLTADSMRLVTKLTEGGLLSKMAAFLVNQTFQQTVAGSEG